LTDEIVIFVTCPAAESDRIASQLVEEQIVACVNIVPGIISIYRWQGKVCRDSEHLLIMKTERKLWQTLEKRVRELHPYDVPEIIEWPIENGYAPYLNWITESVKKDIGEKNNQSAPN
jgi:periplasmic divalent cation tolerance protein